MGQVKISDNNFRVFKKVTPCFINVFDILHHLFPFLDAVNNVHLKGSFLVTKAAWQHFRNQKYGR